MEPTEEVAVERAPLEVSPEELMQTMGEMLAEKDREIAMLRAALRKAMSTP